MSGGTKKPKYEVLREVVLKNGGRMDIVPDVMRSHSFKGWEPDKIRRLVYQIRKSYTDGEIWVLIGGCIYARNENLPRDLWDAVCKRRSARMSGSANQKRIYEEKYKKTRTEKEAVIVLNEDIEILGNTMQSSLKVIRTLNQLNSED